MTEYEIASLALETAAGIREQVALTQTQGDLLTSIADSSFTVLFGYLVVAYFAGKQLTTLQVSILNFLYIVMSLWLALTFYGGHSAAQYQYQELLALQPDRGLPAAWRPEAAILANTVSTIILLASLWFMWSVRHPKKE